MELMILNIVCPLIKVSIADGQRLILHYMGIFVFLHVGHLEIIKMAVGTQDIDC